MHVNTISDILDWVVFIVKTLPYNRILEEEFPAFL